MKLYDLKIGTQLRLGLGLILALVVGLGVLAWLQMDRLWQQTADLYEHPLQVRRAIGEIQAQVFAIHRDMKDLCLVESARERETILQAIGVREADFYRQLEIVRAKYLGPKKDLDDVEQAFALWKAIRAETCRLLLDGKTAEAIRRVLPTGTGGSQTDKVLREIKDVSDFALERGEQFYRNAKALNNSLSQQLVTIVAAILLLSGFTAWLLVKNIKTPLTELTAAAKQFRQGKKDVRSRYVSGNEFGALSAAFNRMAEGIEMEMRINENAAQLAGVMLREEEAHAFCRALLQALLQHTGSQVGAVYFLNEAKTAFEHFESIGLGAGGRAAFSATALEGELGAALASRQIQRVTDIPADARFTFAAVSGDFTPREILTIPVLSDHTVSAVISLASVHAFTAPSLRLVNDIWGVLTARVNGVLAFRKIQDLAVRLDQQNSELNAQTRELVAQANEVTEQNAELEMQKRELDEANRLKSAFLSNMSHELRTPLNSVIALTGVLSRRLRPAPAGPEPSPGAPAISHQKPAGSGDPAYNEALRTIPAEEYGYLEVIERNGKHLLSLINDLLDLSRIEAGREDVSLSQFSVRELVGGAVSMIEPLASEKKIALLNQVSEDLPPLVSDLAKCLHVLQNLVGNAVKFTEHGQVTITAEVVAAGTVAACFQPAVAGGFQPPGQGGPVMGRKLAERPAGSRQTRQAEMPAATADAIRISVADTGIGIAAEHLPHIFDEFRQADDSTSRKHGGTGLGLTIAKKYARLLGGGITVESAPSRGSTFTFCLPVVLERSDAAWTAASGKSSVKHAPAPGPARPGHRQTILVVEDNEPSIIQLTDILRAEGYRVQVARNGREALAQIGQTVPDAMILDLMMPEVDGFQVLKEIRGQVRAVHLPVLILTAKHVTREELSFLKGNHVQQLIQKGEINKQELLAAVARMVAPPPEPPAPLPKPPAPPSSPPGDRPLVRSGKPLILVADDNADSRFTARALLEDQYQIIEAPDGRAGVELARAHRPDLILLDIAMPVMDGVQALQEIRKDASLRHIPVIAATASAMVGDRETILAHGFDGYVTKPLDAGLLIKTLREALD